MSFELGDIPVRDMLPFDDGMMGDVCSARMMVGKGLLLEFTCSWKECDPARAEKSARRTGRNEFYLCSNPRCS